MSAAARAAEGILLRLKHETAVAHQALEDALPLTHPALDRAGYAAIVARFLGFHRAAERTIWADEAVTAALAALGLHAATRRRAPAAERDMVALGYEFTSLPDCDHLPPLGGVEAALGYLYVMEGATLGGRIIARHLERALGIGEATGGAYFAGHGERTGERWRELREALERHVAAGGDADAIVRTAEATFAALHGWMERGGLTRGPAPPPEVPPARG